jgi:molybdopterin/thiamine biosynthesis adenylyltransferase
MLLPHELRRYAQQIKLAEIGFQGQEQLKNLKILCIGAGGLGSSLLFYLAAAGVGTIGIVDGDTIEESNLHRQILYAYQDINLYKAQVASSRIQALNPVVDVITHDVRATPENMSELILPYDIVADCSDNFDTRYLIHDTCYKLNKPYAYASASQFRGHCALFVGSPCLHCVFPLSGCSNGGCTTEGVIGVSPGLLGIIQATEILKWKLNIGLSLHKKLLTVDLLNLQFKEITLHQNPQCPLCN